MVLTRMVEKYELFGTYEYVTPRKSQDFNIKLICVLRDTNYDYICEIVIIW